MFTKKSTIWFLLCLLAVTSFASDLSVAPRLTNGDEPSRITKVEVYYFHFTRRCTTCNAVETVTRESLEANFADQLKNGQITFTSLNLDDETTTVLAEQLKVTGQTLLFKAAKQQKDLTNDGFMYATTNPEKLKEKVKAAILELQQ